MLRPYNVVKIVPSWSLGGSRYHSSQVGQGTKTLPWPLRGLSVSNLLQMVPRPLFRAYTHHNSYDFANHGMCPTKYQANIGTNNHLERNQRIGGRVTKSFLPNSVVVHHFLKAP